MFLVLTDDGSEVACEIGGVFVKAIIDSGSKYNLLSESIWENLKANGVAVSNQRKETVKVFKAYGGHELPLLRAFTSELKLVGKCKTVNFYVIKGEGKLLIGRETATEMGILRLETSVQRIDAVKNHDLLRTIKDVVIDIPIKADAKPVIQPYRRIPIALENAVDAKIDELLKQGVIEKVNKPSKWISPVVAVPKGDSIRICIDMRRANEAVERENHPLPTIEDFLPHLGKGRVFTRLDIKNAFDQVGISVKSREITTFTRRSLFRYTRLMFSITCAPELFRKTMERILSGGNGCFNFFGDLIICGADQEEHDKRLAVVMKTLKEHNVTLNHENCLYSVNELKFLGHVVSSEGIAADPDKLEAIKKFREPETGEEVRSFLGLGPISSRAVEN